MDMPQNAACENQNFQNLWMNEGKESVSFLLRGSSKFDSIEKEMKVS